jgi:histidine triad (HIT) family protein
VTERCVFCGIVAGTEERSVVAEDAITLAFMNLSQQPGSVGHVLVVPRAHVRDIYALDTDTAGAVFAMTARVARAVKAAMLPDGVTILQNNEAAGGQDVFHLHVHIIPRSHDDGWFRGGVRFLPAPRPLLDVLAARIAREMEAR